MRHVVVAAVVAAIAPAGCGGSMGADSERTTARAPASTVASPAKAAPLRARTARAVDPVLRRRHLREFRRMIVALYRVPGAAALNRRYKDPLEQLRHGLGTMYGPVLTPGQDPRSHTASSGERRIPVVRSQRRGDPV